MHRCSIVTAWDRQTDGRIAVLLNAPPPTAGGGLINRLQFITCTVRKTHKNRSTLLLQLQLKNVYRTRAVVARSYTKSTAYIMYLP